VEKILWREQRPQPAIRRSVQMAARSSAIVVRCFGDASPRGSRIVRRLCQQVPGQEFGLNV